ncbi:unnamed protein product [Prorocentrum cordatum]|uniref:Uncharacterized protein n=1 Tax=Prorocentrum cordatum TaxID=2364126 RepID=A0ABN9S600_9DINO|nr:unnamed protein product [Polarella glacialis]
MLCCLLGPPGEGTGRVEAAGLAARSCSQLARRRTARLRPRKKGRGGNSTVGRIGHGGVAATPPAPSRGVPCPKSPLARQARTPAVKDLASRRAEALLVRSRYGPVHPWAPHRSAAVHVASGGPLLPGAARQLRLAAARLHPVARAGDAISALAEAATDVGTDVGSADLRVRRGGAHEAVHAAAVVLDSQCSQIGRTSPRPDCLKASAWALAWAEWARAWAWADQGTGRKSRRRRTCTAQGPPRCPPPCSTRQLHWCCSPECPCSSSSPRRSRYLRSSRST